MAAICLCVVFCALFILFPGHARAGVIVNFTGLFGEAGPFGDAGFEDGSFSGTFTIDPLAPDQYDNSQPNGNLFGRYNLEAWSINFFNSSNVLLGQLDDSLGGIGTISITQDPVTIDTFGNIGLEFDLSANSFFSTNTFSPGVKVTFGAWFNSPSITTDVLPTAFLDATYSGSGLIGFLGGPPDAPATFIDSAAISTPIVVPEPATLLLLLSGLMGLAGKRRRTVICR